jgi:hypothetical protein
MLTFTPSLDLPARLLGGLADGHYSVLRPGVQAATMLAAVASYPVQYDALLRADISYKRLIELLPGQRPDSECYLLAPWNADAA